MGNLSTSQNAKKRRPDGDDGNSAEKKKHVLRKATLKAAEFLGLSSGDLAAVFRVSTATISRLKNNPDFFFDLKSNEAEKALFLIRIYQSLFALIGDDPEQIQSWLREKNLYLNAMPIEAIKTMSGVVNVTEYLDAMRG